MVDLTSNVVVGWTREMHKGLEDVAMGDGSVQQFPIRRLADSLRETGSSTNPIAVP
jgi:hypothetical protein